MAGVPVHQGVILFETNFFKGVEYAHVRLSLKKEILISGGIDPVRFVSQDSECNGLGCQFNEFHFYFFCLDPGEISAKEISQGRQDLQDFYLKVEWFSLAFNVCARPGESVVDIKLFVIMPIVQQFFGCRLAGNISACFAAD